MIALVVPTTHAHQQHTRTPRHGVDTNKGVSHPPLHASAAAASTHKTGVANLSCHSTHSCRHVKVETRVCAVVFVLCCVCGVFVLCAVCVLCCVCAVLLCGLLCGLMSKQMHRYRLTRFVLRCIGYPKPPNRMGCEQLHQRIPPSE